jgi:SAM-dependent methyltransferase
MNPPCPLCKASGAQALQRPGTRRYFHCPGCDLRYLDPAQRLDAAAERERYLLHRNDAADCGYRSFLQPLCTLAVQHLPAGSRGIDFGCGPQPVLAALLEDAGFAVQRYDPFFFPDRAALLGSFDFAVACEVLEHLYDPAQELARVRALLHPGGLLLASTQLYSDAIAFSDWHYPRDPTHVVFYSEQSLRWIADHFGFCELRCTPPRLIALRA